MKPETGQLAKRLERIGRELDAFERAAHPDALAARDRWLRALERPLPERGAGMDVVVEELAETLIPHGMRIADPRFWAFITTGPTAAPIVAATAAMLASPQRYTLTAFNRVEELSLEWLAALCGLGPQMKGLYSSGGSTANLVALGAARQWAFEQTGIDPAAEGLAGRACAVYASTEVHHTVQRAAGVLGLGRSAVRPIPVDARQKLRVDALREAIEADRAQSVLPVAVVATAGTTNTGAIDPLRAIGELAREHGVWLHVDGAYGLPGILDERVRPAYDGLELADSAIVDPHKWLAAPVGVAATFVRDREILHRAFTQEPSDYLEGSFEDAASAEVSFDSLGIPYGDFGVELSAPPRGVQVWAILRELGVEGIAARVREDNDFARFVTERAREHPRLEALTEPELSIACLRYAAPGVADLDAFNRELLRRLRRETPYLPSSTVVAGAFAIRPCFINPRTTRAHVEGFLEALVALGDRLPKLG